MLYENIVSSFMLTLGCAGMIYVQTFPKAQARYAPMVAFAIMIVFSLYLLAKNLWKYRNMSAAGISTAGEKKKSKKEQLLFLGKAIIIFAFFISFKYVYYFITAPIAIIIIGLMSNISWKKVIPTAVIATLCIYGVFIAWLNVYIPM